MRDIVAFILNSKIPQSTYGKVRDLWELGVANNASLPSDWERWRALSGLFNPVDEFRIGDWLPIVDAIANHGWPIPIRPR